MPTRIGLSALVIVGLCAGCVASRQSAYLKTGDTVKPEPARVAPAHTQAAVARAWAAAEAAWAEREDPRSLKAALEQYEAVVKLKPDHRDAMARLARGYYLLGYGYAKTDAEILAAYDAGARWGERMMGLNPEYRKRMEAKVNDELALSACTREDVPGIFWAYANLGKLSVMQGFTTVLKNKGKVKAFIDRVTVLDEKYYHGAGHRGLLAYYAKAPAFTGGDLARAKEHYHRSMAVAPNYFGTRVLMARYYATKMQDKALFRELLQGVIDGDPSVLPDVIPIQKIEQRKARELLAEMDELFE